MTATQVDGCNVEEMTVVSDPIRIAVLGATGVGKSTLCNLICGEETVFEVSGGFDSCTDEVQSEQFIYETDTGDQKSQPLHYEVIDCPGFFDTDVVLTKMNESDIFNDNIKKCIHLTKNGISAYFLLIPYTRMSAYHAASIKFIMEYFPNDAKKYVWLIMTKAGKLTKDDILTDLENPQSKKKEATKLLHKFVIDIDHRLITTECVNVINIQHYREHLLQSVYQTHADNNGPYIGNGIWNALKSQLDAYEKQQALQQEQEQKLQELTKQNEQIIHQNRKNEIWVWSTTAIGVIIAALVVGYTVRRYSNDKFKWEGATAVLQKKLEEEASKAKNAKDAASNLQNVNKALQLQNTNNYNTLQHTKSKLKNYKNALKDTTSQLHNAKDATSKLKNSKDVLQKKLTQNEKLLEESLASCFSGLNTLLIKKHTGEICEIKLCELQVGVYVKSKTKQWTKVWFINKHYGNYKMINLYFNKVDYISLSAEHLLYVGQMDEKCLKRAGDIESDDIIFITNKNGKFNQQKIVSIEYSVEQDAYSPITMDGSIVVSGVLASSYTKSVVNAKRLHESAAIFRLISNVNSDVAILLVDFFYNIIFKGIRCLNLEFIINSYSSPFIVVTLLLFGISALIRFCV
eukprot:260674_1